jgi:hypothetical protein
MKDVLLLHDNARPHTNWRTREAIAKMGWTALPHPAHSPDMAPSDYDLFGPVKDALRGRHFADDNELNQSFRDVLRNRGREFYNTGVQRLIQRWQKRVENEDTVKNSLIIAKDVWIMHVNLIVIAITYSEKKLEALLSYRPSYFRANNAQKNRNVNTYVKFRLRFTTIKLV